MAYDDIQGSVTENVEELTTCIRFSASSKRRGAGYRLSRQVPMPGSIVRVQRICSLRLAGLIILAFTSLAGLAMAAESLCEPGFVRGPGSNPRAIPVAASNLDTTPRLVTIKWLGHSSFMINT